MSTFEVSRWQNISSSSLAQEKIEGSQFVYARYINVMIGIHFVEGSKAT